MYQGSENPSQGDGFAETISAIPSSVDQVNDQVKVSGSVDLVVASDGHAAPCDVCSEDQAFKISQNQALHPCTENSGSDNGSEIGSSVSMISSSTLPFDGRALKRGLSASMCFNTDSIPESAQPAFAKLFEVAEAAQEQAENLRAAVEAVRNALTSGLVSVNSYRLSSS